MDKYTFDFTNDDSCFLNFRDKDSLKRQKERIEESKYLRCNLKNLHKIRLNLRLMKENNIALENKIVVISLFGDKNTLTAEEGNILFGIRDSVKRLGANLMIEDGGLWEIEQVLAVSSKLDKVVNTIKSYTTIDENGVTRQLNEFERFLCAYSYTASRKYKENELNKMSARSITSIFETGDCVCVGFSKILKELCNRLGIECYMNNCTCLEKKHGVEYHQNNIVVLNETAYYCDSCHDCKISDRDPRTFTHCLIPFDDINSRDDYKVGNCSAPFCDINNDLEEITSSLKHLESDKDININKYANYSSAIYKYSESIPNNIEFEPYTEINKEDLIDLHKKAIKLIQKRKIKKPLEIDDFYKAFRNILIAEGKNPTEAHNLALRDIMNSMDHAGLVYSESAKNCFAKEYYLDLQDNYLCKN